jgi:hypothetical protein
MMTGERFTRVEPSQVKQVEFAMKEYF